MPRILIRSSHFDASNSRQNCGSQAEVAKGIRDLQTELADTRRDARLTSPVRKSSSLVSQTFASWNQIGRLLRRLEALRSAAGSAWSYSHLTGTLTNLSPARAIGLLVLGAFSIGPQDWVFFVSAAAALFTVWVTVRGNLAGTIAGVAITAIAGWASHALSRRHPRPMPYFFWWGLLWPRGFLAPGPLKKLLEPRAGERILELGPGIGVHAIPVAAVLAPDGRLDVLDIQQQMLDRLARRAAKAA